MVRILANGDIVPDDDPRAQQSSRRQTTGVPSQQGPHQPARDYQEQGQQVNIFQTVNQKLRSFGIPPWTIGDIVIEPIVSVGLLFALLMFGIHGLIFGIILFTVSRWSTHGAPEIVSRIFGRRAGDGRNNQDGSRPQHRAGGGHRLGR